MTGDKFESKTVNQKFNRLDQCISRMHSTLCSKYMFKINNKNTRTRCEICSKLTIKTPERRHWRRSGSARSAFDYSV